MSCGSCEGLKASVHGALGVLAGLCAIYNAAAWLLRREPHLAVNTVIYSVATVWEAHLVQHHRRPR